MASVICSQEITLPSHDLGELGLTVLGIEKWSGITFLH